MKDKSELNKLNNGNYSLSIKGDDFLLCEGVGDYIVDILVKYAELEQKLSESIPKANLRQIMHKTIGLKFKSGNSIPVPTVTITSDEYLDLLQAIEEL